MLPGGKYTVDRSINFGYKTKFNGQRNAEMAINRPINNRVRGDQMIGRDKEEEALQFIKKYTALSYYVHQGVSLGYAAQIAGMDKGSFIRFLSENGVSIFHFDDEKEFLEELANA